MAEPTSLMKKAFKSLLREMIDDKLPLNFFKICTNYHSILQTRRSRNTYVTQIEKIMLQISKPKLSKLILSYYKVFIIIPV